MPSLYLIATDQEQAREDARPPQERNYKWECPFSLPNPMSHWRLGCFCARLRNSYSEEHLATTVTSSHLTSSGNDFVVSSSGGLETR